jgi:hypothetical protein
MLCVETSRKGLIFSQILQRNNGNPIIRCSILAKPFIYMSRSDSKRLPFKLLILLTLAACAVIIHSCRKDNKSNPQAISDSSVAQAKAWYESTYPLTTNASTSHQTTNSIGSTAFDFSQHTRPDWKHTASYAKLGENVIEMPLDSTAQFNFNLKNIAVAGLYYDKKYTRTYFLMMNDGKNYEAYLMTVIADPAYVKNDLTKLTHNTYHKLDADFSGVILYFTPKGEYLNGYAYQNGNCWAHLPQQPKLHKALQGLS